MDDIKAKQEANFCIVEPHLSSPHSTSPHLRAPHLISAWRNMSSRYSIQILPMSSRYYKNSVSKFIENLRSFSRYC